MNCGHTAQFSGVPQPEIICSFSRRKEASFRQESLQKERMVSYGTNLTQIRQDLSEKPY